MKWGVFIIYIDFTESVPRIGAKFHGGGRYSIRYASLLISRLKNKHFFTLIYPTNYVLTHEEKNLLSLSSSVNIIHCNELNKIDIVDKNAVIFIPLISVKRLSIVKKIKMKYPDIKVFATIHGVRYLDYNFDSIEKYYNSGLTRIFYSLISYSKIIFLKPIYKLILKKYIPFYDKVFTDSNDSMQKLLNVSKPKYIKPFFLGYIPNNNAYEDFMIPKEPFCLFLNSNRPEKNYIRTLFAFIKYIEKTGDNLILVTIGSSDTLIKRINKIRHININIINNNVVFYESVSSSVLNKLYGSCEFTIFTSKSEGFGLPVIEAINNKKPVLASQECSIPEILGSSLHYIDPYSTISIMEGIMHLRVQKNIEYFNSRVEKLKSLIDYRIMLSDEDFINEF